MTFLHDWWHLKNHQQFIIIPTWFRTFDRDDRWVSPRRYPISGYKGKCPTWTPKYWGFLMSKEYLKHQKTIKKTLVTNTSWCFEMFLLQTQRQTSCDSWGDSPYRKSLKSEARWHAKLRKEWSARCHAPPLSHALTKAPRHISSAENCSWDL
jgi:hypothetical protein